MLGTQGEREGVYNINKVIVYCSIAIDPTSYNVDDNHNKVTEHGAPPLSARAGQTPRRVHRTFRKKWAPF